MRGLAGVGLAAAGLLLLPGVARADSPTVSLKPDSGGPGTSVTVSGTGFCVKASCGPVRVTISGQRFGNEVRPDASGSFTSTTQAPGGLTPGEHEIVATQSLDDGNEISGSATFVYSPSRGEAAEREAENRDAVNNLANPTGAPPPATRGIPLESAVAQLSANPSATLPPPGATVSAEAGQQQNDDGFPVVLVASAAAALAALVAGALWWRRRNLGGAS